MGFLPAEQIDAQRRGLAQDGVAAALPAKATAAANVPARCGSARYCSNVIGSSGFICNWRIARRKSPRIVSCSYHSGGKVSDSSTSIDTLHAGGER